MFIAEGENVQVEILHARNFRRSIDLRKEVQELFD
jgi:hypothetical protein